MQNLHSWTCQSGSYKLDNDTLLHQTIVECVRENILSVTINRSECIWSSLCHTVRDNLWLSDSESNAVSNSDSKELFSSFFFFFFIINDDSKFFFFFFSFFFSFFSSHKDSDAELFATKYTVLCWDQTASSMLCFVDVNVFYNTLLMSSSVHSYLNKLVKFIKWPLKFIEQIMLVYSVTADAWGQCLYWKCIKFVTTVTDKWVIAVNWSIT